MPIEFHKLDQWRNQGYMIVLSGAPHIRTGASWVCSIVLDDPNDTATGANNDLLVAVRAALTIASKKWPQTWINEG